MSSLATSTSKWLEWSKWNMTGKFLESSLRLILNATYSIRIACFSSETSTQVLHPWRSTLACSWFVFKNLEQMNRTKCGSRKSKLLKESDVMLKLNLVTVLMLLDLKLLLHSIKRLMNGLFTHQRWLAPNTGQVEWVCGQIMQLCSLSAKWEQSPTEFKLLWSKLETRKLISPCQV